MPSVTESIFSNLSTKFTHFSDSYSSSENRFFVKPTFTVDVMDQAIKTNVIVDHVSGSFKNNYFQDNTEALKYSFTNVGIEPSFVINFQLSFLMLKYPFDEILIIAG